MPLFSIFEISRYDPREKRGHDIQTISLDVWHIFDNDRHALPPSSSGQFYSDDVYIIRWKYKLNPLGNVERKADIARDRLVYWIWQGLNANLNEKGISSIMSIFLNEEKGAQVRDREEWFDGLTKIRSRFMSFKNTKKRYFYNYFTEH